MMSNEKECWHCGRWFRMHLKRLSHDGKPVPARSLSIHFIDPNGLFCTLRCAARYGAARYGAARYGVAKGGL